MQELPDIEKTDSNIKFVHFMQDISSLESTFSMSGNSCIPTTFSFGFQGEVFGVVSTI